MSALAPPPQCSALAKTENPSPSSNQKTSVCRSWRIGPDGSLYAATLPSGKVYRLKPDSDSKQDDSTATVVFDEAKFSPAESKAHYIWDLTFDSTGNLYVATGDPAAVFRLDLTHPNAVPEPFFKSDEAHIRSLAWDKAGNLIAGSDGSGLVYRIDPTGKGYVLFEAPRREITAVAVGTDGTIYAANVGEKAHNPLPPLPVQGIGATTTITIIPPASLQAVNASTTLPDGTEVYALNENQAPRKLWSSKDDIVYALASRPDGLLALTGNRGRIFKIQNDGTYADVVSPSRLSKGSVLPSPAIRRTTQRSISAPETPASLPCLETPTSMSTQATY